MNVRQASKIITNIIRDRNNISYNKQYQKYINKSCLYYSTVRTNGYSNVFMPYQISRALTVLQKHIDDNNKCYNKYKELINYFILGIKIDTAVIIHDIVSTIAPEVYE